MKPVLPVGIRHGAVVAHIADCDEAAALPFLFTVEEHRVVWEARFTVRIGARLEPLYPYAALAPMAEALHGHAVRVRESATVHDPALPVRLARAWGAEPEPHRSALRTCALLGWALARIPDGAPAAARPIHAFLDHPNRSE